jgi:hypothetical protein
MGAFTGATPDGRYAGEVLGNGITPSNSTAVSGPTAIMNSVTKLPLKSVYNGMNLNMRFSGKQTRTANLVNLVKAYFQRGGVQVLLIRSRGGKRAIRVPVPGDRIRSGDHLVLAGPRRSVEYLERILDRATDSRSPLG